VIELVEPAPKKARMEVEQPAVAPQTVKAPRSHNKSSDKRAAPMYANGQHAGSSGNAARLMNDDNAFTGQLVDNNEEIRRNHHLCYPPCIWFVKLHVLPRYNPGTKVQITHKRFGSEYNMWAIMHNVEPFSSICTVNILCAMLPSFHRVGAARGSCLAFDYDRVAAFYQGPSPYVRNEETARLPFARLTEDQSLVEFLRHDWIPNQRQFIKKNLCEFFPEYLRWCTVNCVPSNKSHTKFSNDLLKFLPNSYRAYPGESNNATAFSFNYLDAIEEMARLPTYLRQEFITGTHVQPAGERVRSPVRSPAQAAIEPQKKSPPPSQDRDE
jgi:hypothetical protein